MHKASISAKMLKMGLSVVAKSCITSNKLKMLMQSAIHSSYKISQRGANKKCSNVTRAHASVFLDKAKPMRYFVFNVFIKNDKNCESHNNK